MDFTFILKKFVSSFFMPFPFAMLLLILGIIFLYRHKLIHAKRTLTFAILWLFLFSYPPLVHTIVQNLESQYATLHTAPKGVKYIYVLGNGHHSDARLPITSQVSTTALARLSEGIRLYHQLNEEAHIIVSGYSGLYDPTTHAAMQEKLALALGVKKDHIILRPHPKDTQEEAKAAKAFIGDQTFILVTSASHMQRSMIYFENEGLHPIPAPCNHLASTQHLNYTDFFSSPALEMSTIAFHEFLGMLWQKIKG